MNPSHPERARLPGDGDSEPDFWLHAFPATTPQLTRKSAKHPLVVGVLFEC